MSDKTNKIVITSGKGGVGKSMISSALSMWLAKQSVNLVAVDCDVDAPNLAIWLNEFGSWDKSFSLETSDQAFVDPKKCTGCGICQEKCVFGAVKVVNKKAEISTFLCEGCGRCVINCPQKAITVMPVENGRLNIKKTKYGFSLVSGELYPGESGSGKIVSAVKDKATELKSDFMIIDSSPGTGCPVTAAVRDANYVILVTEPSLSGFADLKRILSVVNHFRIDYGVIVNKWNINKRISQKIQNTFADKYLGSVSYDKNIIKAVANLKPILETNLIARKELIKIFKVLKESKSVF